MTWLNSNDHIIRGVIIGVTAILVIVAPIILFHLYGNAGLQAVSIVTPGLLSLALVVLYFQQHKLLDQQTQLMEQEFESSIALRGSVTAADDTVYLKLRNVGRGAIRYVYLQSEMISDTKPMSLKPGRYQLRTVENGSMSLPGFCEAREFKGKVRMILEDEERETDDSRPFRFISPRLAEAGIEKCTIRLTLNVVDETDHIHNDYHEFEIAEQEIDIGGIEEHKYETKDGETKTIEVHASKSLSEAIKPIYPQDIVRRDLPFFD
jgi:hypothetical protein